MGKRYFRVGRKIFYRIIVILFTFQYYLKMVVKNKKTPLNDEGIRMMTPDEWAKLQGFLGYGFVENGEETFSFPDDVSNTQRYKHSHI